MKKLRADDDVDGLLGALDSKKGSVRIEAAQALGEIGDPRAIEPLLGLIVRSDGTKADEDAAYEAISAIDRTDLLISILKSGEPEVRKVAAFTLGMVGGAEAAKPLLKALEDEDEDVSNYAASGLGRLQDLATLDPLVRHLVERLRRALTEKKDTLDRIEERSARWEAVRDEVGVQLETGLARVWRAITLFPNGVDRLATALDEEHDWLMASAIAIILAALGEERGEELLRARSDRLRGWLLDDEDEVGKAPAGPSVTVWVESEEEARRMVASMSDPEQAGSVIGKALAEDDSAEALAFHEALMGATKASIRSSARTNPSRGGVDVTFVLEND